jgi:hypothetical protein
MIVAALQRLRPGASWSLDGETYTGLTWRDTSQPKPTEEEVNEAIRIVQREYADTEYQRQRAQAYPPITDYLDAIVKSDQAQLDKYIADCQAVKLLYPKP